jgi:cellulose synthase/poly-beta-1,6-N-acetylglucosamine synthase-like glycosyltransferase
MDSIFIIVYALSLSLCAATYFGYPAAIYFISIIKPIIVMKKENSRFFVSIIISAYNEENHIEKKIINTLAQDYPKNKMEIIIGSDGSVD